MRTLALTSCCFLVALLVPQIARAQVKITEISYCKPAGVNEWVELHNTTAEAIDLADWTIKDAASYSESLSGKRLEPNGHLQFQITKDSSVLNDTGDTVEILKSGQVIDSYTYASSIFAQSNAKKIECAEGITFSLALISDTWKPTLEPTPGKANTLKALATPEPTATPAPSPTVQSTSSPSPPAAQPGNIYLSEVYACQEDGQKEWVELWNDNDSDVTLTGWQIKDNQDNHIQPVPNGTTIAKKSYVVIEISEYDIGMFTNTGDTVRLFNGKGERVDSTSYTASCTKGSSWSKFGSEWKETRTVTRGTTNVHSATTSPTASASPTPKASSSPSPTPKTSPSPSASASASPVASASATPEGEILGLSSESTPMPTLMPDRPQTVTSTVSRTPAIVAISIGVLTFAGLGGYLGLDWYAKKHGKVPFVGVLFDKR